MQKYSPQKIEGKWQDVWEKSGINQAKDQDTRPKYYCLDMFPYPSGSGLHVGHWRGYVLSDVAARIKKSQGYNVLHPMGWDAFGLPAENYAVKYGVHPRISTDENIATYKKQLVQMASCFDWTREIDTTNPEYYKYTQWIFLQMYKRGLAYRSELEVNWCEALGTVLANEEVVDGKSEVGGYPVTKKKIPQWVLKITAYADRLLADLDSLEWPEKVKTMQRNWIGKSEGTLVKFKLNCHTEPVEVLPYIEVFTTRVDTLFGCTYIVLAPENSLIQNNELGITNYEEVQKYIKQSQAKTNVDRLEDTKEKTGVRLDGIAAINPINNEEIPVFVADYVLGDYGTGAVMAVPAHDERDWAFAKKFDLPIKWVISGYESQEKAFEYDGVLIDSGKFTSLTSPEARIKITEKLASMGAGELKTNYKLRDWIFSRQRYWGEPIPLIHCENCAKNPQDEGEKLNPGWIAVPESELPLRLPEVEKYEPTGTGESPLAGIPEFVNTTCPRCGGPAKRETNTMPQWAGSCWYYMAYAMKGNTSKSASLLEDDIKAALKHWLPVDLYVGGVEHAVLHLLYARFWHKVLFDIGVVDHPEPFKHLFNQGMVTLSGAKMSKSKGNVVSPDEMIEKYGTDALRAYELFIAPPEQDAEWNSNGLSGVARFLSKVWDLATEVIEAQKVTAKNQIDAVAGPQQNNPATLLDASIEIPETELQVKTHQTIKKFNEALGDFRYNTLVSTLMEFTNTLTGHKETLKQYPQPLVVLIQLLSPICPHISEELWQQLGFESSLFSGQYDWPQHNTRYLMGDLITITIQENGKLRGTIEITPDSDQGSAESALRETKYAPLLDGAKKVVFIKNKIINIVR